MGKTGAANPIPSPRSLRLLIVEDSPADAELMVAALKRAGYLVTFDVVDSPGLFEQRLGQADYDVILSDHNLTAWAGTGALELRQRSGKDIPFVVVTGALGDEAAVEYLKRGAADYVLKQRLERLPVAVDHALRDKDLRQEAARLQETIHRGKKEWELTFDSVPDPMFLLDEHCRIKRANRAAAAVLGSEFAQLIGRPCYEVLYGAAVPPPDNPHEGMLATGKEVRSEIEVPRLGKIFDVTAAPLCDPDGVLRGSVHVMRDITERKRAEEALRQAEEKYRNIFENAVEGIFQTRVDGHYLTANPTLARIYGYESPEELMATVRDLEHQFYVEPSRRAEFVRRVQEHGAVSGFESQVYCKDGSVIWISENARALRDASGRVVGLEGTTVDITDRKRVEEALRRSEARYRNLVENATYGIYRSTVEGKFLDVNPALVAMLGYDSKEELLAVNPTADLYRDPGQRGRIVEAHRQMGRIEGLEVEWKRKDGKPIAVRLSGRAVRDENGAVEGFEVIAEDVTERRTLEKQLRQAQKFEAIGQLAGGVAHDFNNVIGAILGWADLGLHEAAAASSLHNRFQKIRDQAERAATLTRQLLAFARRQVLEPRNINLNQTVADVFSLLEKLIGEQIEVRTVLAPDLEVARADPVQVEQVLVNLCMNARDAMPRGGRLLIETQNVEFDEEYCRRHVYAKLGRYVLLSVSDTGVGMDAVTMEHIFEPFFTTKETGKGTGLGLATVYGIVKQHGGFINVYSEPGQGATFRVYLPVGGGVVEEQEKTATEPVRGGTETLLLAEDHEGVRDMARETLEKLGYQVLLAGDGEEAARMFEAHRDRIALVLLDVVLPKLSGPEAYARMSAVKPGVAVVFSTGHTAEAAQLNSMLKKGVAFLQKPYSPDSLARKVRDILDRARQR